MYPTAADETFISPDGTITVKLFKCVNNFFLLIFNYLNRLNDKKKKLTVQIN